MATHRRDLDLDLLLVGQGEITGGGRGGKVKIVDVWAHNLETELEVMGGIVSGYPIVAVTASPDDARRRSDVVPTADSSYETLRAYMDRLCFGQVMFAFTNPGGELALQRFWRFHVGDFDPDHLHFFEEIGVDVGARRVRPCDLGNALVKYDMVVNPGVTWVTYDGAADLALLLRCILPLGEHCPTRWHFIRHYEAFFPGVYDLKVLAMYGELSDNNPVFMAADNPVISSSSSSIVPLPLVGVERYRGMLFGIKDGMAVGYKEPYSHPKDDYYDYAAAAPPPSQCRFGRNLCNLASYKLVPSSTALPLHITSRGSKIHL